VASDRQWHDATPPSGGVRAIDGSRLRRTEPRSGRRGRILVRASHEEERGGLCDLSLCVAREEGMMSVRSHAKGMEITNVR